MCSQAKAIAVARRPSRATISWLIWRERDSLESLKWKSLSNLISAQWNCTKSVQITAAIELRAEEIEDRVPENSVDMNSPIIPGQEP